MQAERREANAGYGERLVTDPDRFALIMMKRFRLFGFGQLLLILWLIPLMDPVHGEDAARYIILTTDAEARDSLTERFADGNYQFHDSVMGVSLSLSDQDRQTVRSFPGVTGVHPDEQVSIHEEAALSSWGFETVNQTNRSGVADEQGEGTVISVIDTGIERNHPNLRYHKGICLISVGSSCDNGYQDDNGHGTHVAGIINAQGAEGVKGIAPKASLLVVRAMNQRGDGRISDVIAGIEWSVEQGADIINLSITTENTHPVLNESLDYAIRQGVFLVGAAGNIHEPVRPVMYPAKHPDVHAIAAVDRNRQPTNFSAFGPEIHFAGPGSGILSTGMLSEEVDGRSGYSIKSGTSMATPFAAGVMALYMERYPHLTNSEITRVMEFHALRATGQSERNPFTGFGVVQVPKALGDPIQETIPVTVGPAGRVDLELSLVSEGSYTLYRNGIEMASQQTGPVFTDYVHPGSFVYEIYLETDGEEQFYGKTDLVRTSGVSLRDVTPENWYYRDVHYLSSNRITVGFPDGTFRPYQHLTRAEAAAMIVRGLGEEGSLVHVTEARFMDVPEHHFAYEAIHQAKALGIVGGYRDGTFRPGERVSRAEVAIMLSNAWFRDHRIVHNGGRVFSDVYPDQASYQAVMTLYELGITDGFADGTFRGDRPILRNQYARLLTNAHEQAGSEEDTGFDEAF